MVTISYSSWKEAQMSDFRFFSEALRRKKSSQEVHREIYFPAYVGFLKVEVACLKIGFSPVSHLCSILSFSNL